MAKRPAEEWKFSVGESGPNGRIIGHIYGHTDTLVVFQDEDGRTNIETNTPQPSQHERRVLQRFDYLDARITMLFSGEELDRMKADLASAVFAAMMGKTAGDQNDSFQSITDRIGSTLIPAHLGLASLVAALFVAVSFIAYYGSSDEPTRQFALLVLCATLGSITSVLLQGRELGATGGYFSRQATGILGAARVVTGVLLSIGLLLAIEANLVLGIAKDSFPSLLTFMFVAGFFDRFAINTLKRLAGPKAD